MLFYAENRQFCAPLKSIPVVDKCCLFFLFICLLPPITPLVFRYFYTMSFSKQLIVAGQTTSFHPDCPVPWCKGMYVSETTIGFSDNPDGLSVSAFLVDNSNIITGNVTILPNTKYGEVNRSIDDGSDERYLIPLDYYGNPLYLLKGSTITLHTRIYIPVSADQLKFAFVYFFDSYDEAVKYEEGKASSKNLVHRINVTQCTEITCSYSYTVHKDSFYFFVLSSGAYSSFNITTNFTFNVLYYANSYSHSNVVNISVNESGYMDFDKSKTILFYTHPSSDNESLLLGHLNFELSRREVLQIPVIVVSIVPFTICLVVLLFRFISKFWKCKPSPNPEVIPLIN